MSKNSTAAITAAVQATAEVARLRRLLREAEAQAAKAVPAGTREARRAFQALSGRWDERTQAWKAQVRPTQEELVFFLVANLGGRTKDGVEVSVAARLHVLDGWRDGRPPAGPDRHHTADAVWTHELELRDQA